MGHISQASYKTHGAQVKRHDDITRFVAGRLWQRSFAVERQVRIQDGGTFCKPDILACKGDEAFILDTQVSADNFPLTRPHHSKCDKYGTLEILQKGIREPDTIRIPENNIAHNMEHIEVSRDEVDKNAQGTKSGRSTVPRNLPACGTAARAVPHCSSNNDTDGNSATVCTVIVKLDNATLHGNSRHTPGTPRHPRNLPAHPRHTPAQQEPPGTPPHTPAQQETPGTPPAPPGTPPAHPGTTGNSWHTPGTPGTSRHTPGTPRHPRNLPAHPRHTPAQQEPPGTPPAHSGTTGNSWHTPGTPGTSRHTPGSTGNSLHTPGTPRHPRNLPAHPGTTGNSRHTPGTPRHPPAHTRHTPAQQETPGTPPAPPGTPPAHPGTTGNSWHTPGTPGTSRPTH
nr:sialidase-like [Procambarus clarkii]